MPVNTLSSSNDIRRGHQLGRWQKIADLPKAGASYTIQCVDQNFCWLYDPDRLWRSSDGGETWTALNTADKQEDTSDYHFINREVGWKYSHEHLFKTTDSGETWTNQPTPLDSEKGEIRAVWLLDTETAWIAGGIYRPLTKEEERIGVPNNSRYGNSVLDAAVFRSNDGGKTWSRQDLSPKWIGRILDLKFFDMNHGLALGEIVYYTDDGGTSWRRPVFPDSCVRQKYLTDDYDGRPAYLDIYDSKLWRLSYDDGRVVKSTNGGRSWCDLVHPGQVVFAEAGREYFTTLHFDNPDHGWGLGWDRSLYETSDGGKSWQSLSSDTSFHSLFFMDRGNGWLVSNSGVFRIKS